MPDSVGGRIILVRHGETEANRLGCFAASEDVPLTSVGRQQADELASKITERFVPHQVFSSKFLRARQTADIIGRSLGLSVEVLAGIQEREFGALRGQPYQRMGAMMRNDVAYEPNRRWLWAPPGGESLESVRARAVAVLMQLQRSFPTQDVIVVSHGAVMECIGAHISGDWENASVPPNCGLVVVGSRIFDEAAPVPFPRLPV